MWQINHASPSLALAGASHLISACLSLPLSPMATPAARGLAPTPPDKGSFPLDHFGDCKLLKAEYLMCLQRSSERKTEGCRIQMKQYLECRMQQSVGGSTAAAGESCSELINSQRLIDDSSHARCLSLLSARVAARSLSGLMAQEDLSRLGFANVSSSVAGPGVPAVAAAAAPAAPQQAQKKA